MKWMRKEVKKLRTILGRVVRDVERKAGGVAAPSARLKADLEQEIELSKRVMVQERSSKNKVYSAQAPEVECISKGKAHKRYEFGVKVGIAVTAIESEILAPDIYCWALFMLEPKNLVRQSFKKLKIVGLKAKQE